MKHRKSTRVLSFYLAILAAVMLLSFGTLSVYAAENEPPTDDIPTDETVIDSQSTADQSEYEESAEVAADETEMETEVLYYEYEIENTAMTAPPMTAPPMTDIGGSVDPDGLELETGFLQSGVYAIENVGNDNYYMSVESGSVDSGFRVVQQNYGSNTPLTNFSRASLFKVTRIGETNRYIIRAMTNNRLSICPDTDINEDEMITGFINTDDANALGRTYTIVMAGSLCTIKPYGSSEVIAAPNSTASGDTNAEAAQLTLMTQTAAGTRGKWRFTKYTGNEKYGYHIYRTAGMGDGLVKGNTGTIWLKTWSTVINANTPYLAIKSPYSSVATADWQANNYLATITAHKCGDYEMEIQTRLGSSSTVQHTQSTTYTVIPDIVGDTTFVQNVATGKYMEVESASEANGGIVQQWSFHTGEQAKWIFELDGNGYFKIKNVNSGKYLGANSSNVSEVRQYDTVTDYSRWKIVETSTGNYRLICKASTWRYSVLATPTTTDGDGVNLTVQTTYTDDTSYNDEWKIYAVTRILNDIPTSLRSTTDHLCIPCAITNIAGYWSINGYSQFGCSTSTQQETVARAVHQKMLDEGGSATANRNIQIGFDYFSHTDGSKTYIMESTNIWRGDAEFSIETIMNEINAGRPLMIGYAAVNGSPYSGHMTVCAGYDFSGGAFYVYVSDAHNGAYQKHLFNGNTYNDFIATVECVIGSN